MKARITAILSLSGVLVAGSAAALVNTQVLQSSSSGGDDVAFAADDTVSSVAPSISVDTTMPTTVLTPVAVATQATYQIGDAGLVVLDTAGDVLTIVSTTPNAGWVLHEAEQEGPNDVEVKFRSATVEVEFKANLLLGVVNTSVESRSLGQPAPAGTPGTAPTNTVDDDDMYDDDMYDDDDDDDMYDDDSDDDSDDDDDDDNDDDSDDDHDDD